MVPSIQLEVCLTSVDDALVAVAAGADRLELNAALALGGLTPSAGMIRVVTSAVKVPVITMLRPHAAGFCYSPADFDVMQIDLTIALQYGSAGIAFGILRDDAEIDKDRCRIIREIIGRGQAVFHRAFDFTPDPFRALEELIDLGFTRVMTSGQRQDAIGGRDLIRQLIDRARGRIEVLPAGGINPENVRDLIAATGCNQVHGSFRGKGPNATAAHDLLVPSAHLDERINGVTDFNTVAAMRAILDS